MTDEVKIKKTLDALEEKLRNPKVPNDWNGRFTIEGKQGGVMDIKGELKV
jgi:hypothetical protein